VQSKSASGAHEAALSATTGASVSAATVYAASPDDVRVADCLRGRAIFSHAPIGLARTTLDNRILEANEHFCRLLGYTAAELRTRSLRDLTHPDDRDNHDHLRRALLDARIASFNVRKRYARRDGTWVLVERTVAMVRDAANDPPYLIQVFQDVTERARQEALERLRLAMEQEGRQAHERRYHETFDQAPVGIAHSSADGRYLKVNRRFCEMLDYDESELVGAEAAAFEHPEDRDRSQASKRSMWEGKLAAFQDEQRYLCKDGKVLWARLTISLARNGGGSPMYFICVAEDVTERRSIEENYRTTFDNAPVGIMHTAVADDRILRANRKLAELLGCTREDLIGRPGTELLRPDVCSTEHAKYRQQLIDGQFESYSSERPYLRKDGSTIWVNRTVSLVRDAAGEPDYFIRIVEDITERILSVQRRSMEHAVAKVLAEAASVAEAMPLLIRTMCEACHWCYGTYWCWSEPEQTLVRAAMWRNCEMPFESAEEESPWVRVSVRNPAGLIGGAWFEGEPRWIEDMHANASFGRRRTASRFGFRSALSFPIVAGGETIGIMEFFAAEVRKADEVLLQTVVSIGRQIGQFVQRSEAEQALRASEERYRDMFESSPVPMWLRDDETPTIITVNQAAVDHYGYSREEFIGMDVRKLWDPAEHGIYAEENACRSRHSTAHLKRRHVTKDGRVRDLEITARAFDLGGRWVWLTLLNDVTERVRAEEQLVHLAHYDPLTGLPNRVLFYERLKHALVLGKRQGWSTAVMFMDIDRFKNINDTLGHDLGDQLLREVSQRLAAAVRASDTVGRLGGDEFAVVLSNVSSREDAGRIARKMMESFHEPFRLSGSEIFVTTSIGITLAPQDGAEQEMLMKNADAAMYKAKEEGRNTFRCYSPEMSDRALRLVTLEASLRRALERDEFMLHYQPKVCVESGAVTGVEALLRWRHPGRGLVSPAEFIPVLEETGLIVQASGWVLDAVCRQLRQWRAQGVPSVPVAVNLSAREFLAPDLGRTIKRILEAHAIAPSALELEITESSLMVNPQEAARTLEYLKALGVGLAIDDFGTGYSSLSYLKRFPLDALKIDRSFVRDITANANDAAITLAIISMAHSLGLKVIAEGVEEHAQLDFLAAHGCDQVQGFLLARPVDAEQCARLLHDPSFPRPANG